MPETADHINDRTAVSDIILHRNGEYRSVLLHKLPIIKTGYLNGFLGISFHCKTFFFYDIFGRNE